MNRLLCSASLLITLALLPFSVLAGPYRADCGAPPQEAGVAAGDEARGRHFERLATILDLSAEQRRQIDALREAERRDTESYRRQLRESREAIHALTRSEPFDGGPLKRRPAGTLCRALLIPRALPSPRCRANYPRWY